MQRQPDPHNRDPFNRLHAQAVSIVRISLAIVVALSAFGFGTVLVGPCRAALRDAGENPDLDDWSELEAMHAAQRRIIDAEGRR